MKCFLTGLGPVKAKLLALQMHQLSFEDLITVEDGQKKKKFKLFLQHFGEQTQAKRLVFMENYASKSST